MTYLKDIAGDFVTPEDLPDGIYFDLSFEVYHALPRLSSSGIANMLISPATYWAESWMNPDRDKPKDEAAAERQGNARLLGRAYHTARLEPHLFPHQFVRDLDPADYPDALMNGTQIGEKLGEIGATKKKAGESVMDQAMRLKEAGYGGVIWCLLRDEFDRQHEDRTAIKPRFYDDIVRDMERIKSKPEIVAHLTGGAAEVSVLWTDERSGVKRKARLDYLKPEQFTDFKSFSNSMGKVMDQCLADQFRYNRYYIQAPVYFEATEQIRTTELPVFADDPAFAMSLVNAIRKRDRPLSCWYVFQEKDGIPNLLAREIRLFTKPANGHAINHAGTEDTISDQVGQMTVRMSALHLKARSEIDFAVNMFRFYRDEFGDAPWPPLAPTGEISDDDFPPRWLES